MDALTLLIVYLVTQNPDFQGNLTPICDKLKQSEDMLKFLGSLSAFPCSPTDKPDPKPPCDPPRPCDSGNSCDPCAPCNPFDPPSPPPRPTGNTNVTGSASTTGSNGSNGTGSYTGARGANANAGASANAGADNQPQTPLRTLGGEWLEKYITKYLKN